MIFTLIRRIRYLPKPRRDAIALSIAGGFTFIIVIIWVVQLPGKLSFAGGDKSTDVSAFSTLFSGVGEQFSTLQASVAAINASSSAAASAQNQGVVDEALYAEEVRYFGQSTEATSTIQAATASTTAPVAYGQVVRIATTSASTTSSSSVLY